MESDRKHCSKDGGLGKHDTTRQHSLGNPYKQCHFPSRGVLTIPRSAQSGELRGRSTLLVPPARSNLAIAMGNEVSTAKRSAAAVDGPLGAKNTHNNATQPQSPGQGVSDNIKQQSAMTSSQREATAPPPATQQTPSNLTVLLNQLEDGKKSITEQDGKKTEDPSKSTPPHLPCEADSASGPPPAPRILGSSAPSNLSLSTANVGKNFIDPGQLIPPTSANQEPPLLATKTKPSGIPRQQSSGAVYPGLESTRSSGETDFVRRCMSSKELGTLAPPSGSPYAYMLQQKEQLEVSMRQRLLAMRESVAQSQSDESSSTTSTRRESGKNAMRNKRRAQHNQAVIDDLCQVVADLFLAESKLLKPLTYGVRVQEQQSLPDGPVSGILSGSGGGINARVASRSQLEREQVVRCIHNFLSALPMRYALSADTPSEVLLHMRLMAAARADKFKAVVHIHNLDAGGIRGAYPAAQKRDAQSQSLRLVTISCNDATGLLEYITKLLATGGSRVVDADVMLSTDGIVLDRFVVEMTGRLRLDKFANLIETFLREKMSPEKAETPLREVIGTPSPDASGPLYYTSANTEKKSLSREWQEEMETAIPLTHVLASRSDLLLPPNLPKLRKMRSMPTTPTSNTPGLPNVQLAMRAEPAEGAPIELSPELPRVLSNEQNEKDTKEVEPTGKPARNRRQLVNRKATSNLDEFETNSEKGPLDYVTIPNEDIDAGRGGEDRVVPLIPFDELMLIETLGTGRVSTIYRAAWQRGSFGVNMVALKVAMVNSVDGDTSHVDELRREADIAARLAHPNICDLVGVAADPECFCLAYDYCEGGSLLSLLTNPSRYYEYLPIALDIANGMAYLHSRNVIHRDLKPSNILLTRDHRAKISDFGMSVANTGQELTAETGTYRYMAPEVIRHESYSSNADVYSFGICLWQLITREIPFATMTPIQAAYAVAEGRRPAIPPSTPRRLQEIIMTCWDTDSYRRPSFTYIAMALADYAKMAFSPANVGALTLQIANEMLANVEGNSTVNVDFSTPVAGEGSLPSFLLQPSSTGGSGMGSSHSSHNLGLEIE